VARQNINVGTLANDGTGDPLRTGMQKVNDNFTELYTDAPVSNTITVGNNSVNTFINATAVFIGNSSVNTQINTISISTRDAVFTGDLTVSGNVYFQGETTFSNAINITTTDKMIVLANGTANAAAANSSGIAINTFANLIYITDASGWQSNVNIVPATNNLTLGNTTSIWKVYANTINAVNISTTSNTSQLGTAFYVTATGNVGIGNSAPTNKLRVEGDLSVLTTLDAGNTTITGFVNTTSNINALSYSIGSSFVANQSGLFHIGMVEATDLHVNSYFIANSTQVTIGSGIGLSVNGSIGTGGQVLTSNGSSVYWDTIPVANTSGAVNVDAQYTWSNLHVFTANVHLNGNTNINGNSYFTNAVSVSGNSTFSNQVSITGNVTISNAVSITGNATFSNSSTFSGNVTFSNTITANGSVGANGQVLTTNGSGIYWANASGGTSIALNANNTDTSTYYLPMANTDTGTWSNGVVSNTLYYVPSTGTLSATVFNSLSDKEKKENIEVITDAIEIINKINGVRFDWKNNHEPSAGLIAQDVEKVMPELVHTDPNTGDKSLNYSGIIAVLVEAVKYLVNKG